MSFSEDSESQEASDSKLSKSSESSLQDTVQPSAVVEDSEETLNPKQQEWELQRYIQWSSGPIPSPETLRQYDLAVPGFAEKFLDSFLEESKHRRQLDNKLLELDQEELRQQGSLLDKNHSRSLWGLAAGSIITLFALGSAVFVTVRGHPWVGGVIGGTTTVGLAGVFVVGKLKEQASEEVKSQKDEDSPLKED